MATLENQELEIDQANQRFYRAFESLDIRKMEAIWATDKPVKCIHPGWGLRSGWPAVRDSWVLIFNNTTGIRFEVTDVDIMVNSEMAWVTCVEHVTTMMDGEPHVSRVLATNLYAKNVSGWLMIHHHGSPVFSGAADR